MSTIRRITTDPSERPGLRDWTPPPPFIPNKELKRPNLERRLFADWPGAVDRSGRLTPEEETLLFKQLHFSGYRLRQIYRAATRRVTPARKVEYSLWLQRYNALRTRIVEANLGLVYDLIGRNRFDNLDRDELLSEGMMGLLRATDTFDPWRGYRFSTYACNAILRAFSRAALMDSKRRGRIAGPYDVDFEESDVIERTRMDQRSLFAERLSRILADDVADLTDVERSVLAKRFPAEDEAERQTLEDIGRKMRVSKERVRQIQLSAIAKLRKALAADPVLQ